MDPHTLKKIKRIMGDQPTTIYDILVFEFGEPRVKRALRHTDPEVYSMYDKIQLTVTEYWKKKYGMASSHDIPEIRP
jgi:hypothetical protein